MTGPVLVVAAHPDDEVLGCGGTMAKWAREGRDVHVLIMADGETSRGEVSTDARSLAAVAAGQTLGVASVEQLTLADNRMDRYELLDVVQMIEARITKIHPTTILTHHAGDVNVDHRIVHQAVVTACRPQPGYCVRELMYFEVPSSTEWQTPSTFAPNVFVDVTFSMVSKLAALGCYHAEMRDFPHARSYYAVSALAKWRGATAGYVAAEAFMLGRLLA